MGFWEHAAKFGEAVAALLIVLDPLAIMPVFVAFAGRMTPPDVRHLTWKVIGGATVLLLLFTITGTWVLRLFDVTLDDLRIGGGLLLMVIAFRMVIEGSISGGRSDDYQAAIVPLISPLLVGPGAITASVVLAAINGVWITALAGAVAMLISLGLLMAAGFINRLIGSTGADLVTRIMGVLIATIAVSYIRVGIKGYIEAL